MKFCKNCGHGLEDDAIFCAYCGCAVETEDTPITPTSNDATNTSTTSKPVTALKPIKPHTPMTKRTKLMLATSGALLVAATIVGVMVSNEKKTVHLSDFYEIEYDGGDGFASAYVSLDEYALESKICEIKGISEDSYAYWNIANIVESGDITLEATPSFELHNGDDIEINFNIPDKKFIKGVILDDSPATVTVEGLEVYKEITDDDLFKDIELIYTNYSPFLTLKVENTSKDPFLSSVFYTVENNDSIANGDTVTIEASWNDAEAENNKCLVTGSGVKTVKVDNQATYLLDKAQLTDEMLKQLIATIEADYRELSKNWNGDHAFIKISDICLCDNTTSNSLFRSNKNYVHVLIEVKPDEYDKHHDVNYFDGYYSDVTFRDGELYLGELNGSRWDINYTSSSYNDSIESYKSSAKATFDLFEG